MCAGMSGHVCVAGVGIGKWTQNGWRLGERERKSKSDMDIECKRETEKEGIGMWGEVVKDKKQKLKMTILKIKMTCENRKR